MTKLSGVIPPMITPFDANGKLDENALVELTTYLSPRVDGLFICGSYGCGPLMNLEERKRVAEVVKKTASPNVKVVVHSGATSTADTIALSLHARDIGCFAASAVGPYYYAYTDADLILHYGKVLDALEGFPFYAYHNPKFQGYETSLKALRTLKDKGLAGIKDATFDIIKFAAYARELMDDDFDIALGTEAMWISAHALGCNAFIPGIGNVFPEICRGMWEKSVKGDAAAALADQFFINRIRDVLYMARSTQLAIYAIAEIKGIVTSIPRAPFIPATSEEKRNIEKALSDMGAL